MKIYLLLFSMVSLALCCTSTKKIMRQNFTKGIDVHGHRGARGYMPENTIESFVDAIKRGASTIELDVVISKDHQVVVSHEAWFNHEITTLPDGSLLTKAEEQNHRLYTMEYSTIKTYDVGLKYTEKFPQQKKIKAFKPKLSEVFEACDAYTELLKLPLVDFNIEIKYANDTLNPPAEKFVTLVLDEIRKAKMDKRVLVQSFSHTIVNQVYTQNPKLKTAILIGDINNATEHLSKLNHKPYAYNPYYELVDANLMALLKKKDIHIYPWTVNTKEAASKLLDFQIDGIITDYPDLIIDAIKQYKKE